MATAEAAEFIQCPVATAFALISQPERHPLWQHDLERDGVIEGDGGVGSRGREARRFMGRLVVTEYEVTEFQPPQRWAMRSVTGPISMAGTLTCVPAGDGTQVTMSLAFSGWYGEAMARFAKRQFQEHLAALKELIETGSPAVTVGPPA